MTKVLILLLVFVGGEVREFSFVECASSNTLSPKPQHFLYVYNHIRTNIEGNYVWHPSDKGGETYGGIARRVYPSWSGWKYIDAAKPLKRHDKVEAAEYWVQDFYLDLWVKGGFYKIENLEVALNLFDFAIHSSPRTVELKVNRVLTKLGCDEVRVAGEWITDDFNRVPPREFALLLKIERIKLFNYLVTKDATQLAFYKGWLRRVDLI